jgi:hypothetical protein
VALPHLTERTEAEIAATKPAEKWRLQQQAQFFRELQTAYGSQFSVTFLCFFNVDGSRAPEKGSGRTGG